jgi:hypothetical protein
MENNWSLKNNVFNADFSVDEIINSIRLFEILKNKYPNDELIDGSIEVLRNEICNMFGGTIYFDE